MADFGNRERTKLQGKTNEEIDEEIIKSNPFDRKGQPHEIANFVSFLVSKEADYITGESMMVNRGFHFFLVFDQYLLH